MVVVVERVGALVLQEKRQCRPEKVPTVDGEDVQQQLLLCPGFRALSSVAM